VVVRHDRETLPREPLRRDAPWRADCFDQGAMKATDLLKKQHRTVEALFKKLLSNGAVSAPALVMELADDLAAHMEIEQTILYPAARAVDKSLVLESYEEHAIAELALKRLLACGAGDETFEAKVTALRDLIHHHVEEEEDELFPKLEKALDLARLKAMGKQMEEAFDAAKERGISAELPKGSKTTADAARRRAPNGQAMSR
jgi:hemerythrin-like domain-containing protein